MAGLALPPGFGANSWAEDTWAAAMAAQLPRFRVSGPNAWKPVPATGLDRVVQLAAGGGWACGVWDRTIAVENAPQHDANTGSSDRYDLVVARYDWATDTRTFAIIKGTDTPPAINATTGVVETQVNRIPGTRYEGIIAVVRVRPGVGQFAGTDIFDLRPYGSGGVLYVPQLSYIAWLDLPYGAQIMAAAVDCILTRVPSWPVPAADGTSVPDGAWIGRLRTTKVVQVSNAAGGFVVGYGLTFTKVIAVALTAGDNAAQLGFVVPVGANHTNAIASGQAWKASTDGLSLVDQNANIRVELDVIGFI